MAQKVSSFEITIKRNHYRKTVSSWRNWRWWLFFKEHHM